MDCGASIVVPQVDTVEQAKHVVSAAKYGTKQNGTRSAPPFRLIPGLTDTPMLGNDIHKSLNNQAAIMIQIETLEGINNLDAMLTEVPDIDIVWLGSLDCRISMNMAANMGMSNGEPEWAEAEKKFEDVLKKHNKPRGGFGFGPMVKQNTDKGHACKYSLHEPIEQRLTLFTVICFDADIMKLASIGQSFAETKAETAYSIKG